MSSIIVSVAIGMRKVHLLKLISQLPASELAVWKYMSVLTRLQSEKKIPIFDNSSTVASYPRLRNWQAWLRPSEELFACQCWSTVSQATSAVSGFEYFLWEENYSSSNLVVLKWYSRWRLSCHFDKVSLSHEKRMDEEMIADHALVCCSLNQLSTNPSKCLPLSWEYKINIRFKAWAMCRYIGVHLFIKNRQEIQRHFLGCFLFWIDKYGGSNL